MQTDYCDKWATYLLKSAQTDDTLTLWTQFNAKTVLYKLNDQHLYMHCDSMKLQMTIP